MQSTRNTIITSDPTNVTSRFRGSASIDPASLELSGVNTERQDDIIGPSSAPSFAGYFVARFSSPFASYGTANGRDLHQGSTHLDSGDEIASWVTFAPGTTSVSVRVGLSFISVEQARRNLDAEIPDGTTLEQTAYTTRSAWKDKLELVDLGGGKGKWERVFFTGLWCVCPLSSSWSIALRLTLRCSSQARSSVPVRDLGARSLLLW